MSKLTASKLLSRCRRALGRWFDLSPRDEDEQQDIDRNRWVAWIDRRLNPYLYRSPLANDARQRNRLPMPPLGRSRR